MIRRDLPAGSEVEVTLKMDESRILTVAAYVPLLDEEFAAKIEMKRHQPNPDDLKKDYESGNETIPRSKIKAAATGRRDCGKIGRGSGSFTTCTRCKRNSCCRQS